MLSECSTNVMTRKIEREPEKNRTQTIDNVSCNYIAIDMIVVGNILKRLIEAIV